MGVEERKKIISALEKKLDARILSIILGDRQHLETKAAPDILPLVSDLLTRIGSARQFAIFLYTRGGDSIVGWSLVNLTRQYCDRLVVVVPFRALSCGTLIALGAEEILMSKHGQLSPIDPSVASPFNPPAPGSPVGQPGPVTLLPVSVEDMAGFLDLARNEVGLRADESMVEVLKILADKVHPLALGAVHRAREQNRELASRLLAIHMDDQARINFIVDKLTKELPTHSYLIGLNEAKDYIRLHVTEMKDEIEKLTWNLYKEYESWLELTTPHSPELDLGSEDQKRVRYERAVVECLDAEKLSQHIFVTDKILLKTKVTPPGMQVPVDQVGERTIYQGWLPATDGEVLR
jgi:uncharacterized protein (DUF2164 family)